MSDSSSEGAIGFLETLGLVASIEAADAMLKASRVRLVRQQRTVPGLVTHFVVGETAAVRSAVDAGATAAGRVGKVLGKHVIPRPAPDVWEKLLGVKRPDDESDSGSGSRKSAGSSGDVSTELESLTVAELRTLARERDAEGLKGRAIARARKGELIAYLRGED